MADVDMDSTLLEASFNGKNLPSSGEQDGETKVIAKGFTVMDQENGDSGPKDDEPVEGKDDINSGESVPKGAETAKKAEEYKGKGARSGNEKGNLSKEKVPGRKRKVSEEVKEPVSPFFDRPVRERKSIDRFVASAEKEKVRELKIEKGTGTFLKDIPNVVFKLSKKKGNDESVHLLHKLLYGKKVKPIHAKPNILQFSGYVWGPNQEKEKVKVKERLDKNNKENIFQVAEILDINFHRSEKKEDIIVKLLSFLESPHRTKDKLLEDSQKVKGKKLKGKKRKIKSQKGTGKESSGQTPKKRQKTESTPSKTRHPIKQPIEMEDDVESEEPEEQDSDEEEEPVTTKRRKKDESDDEDFDAKPKRSKKGRNATKKLEKRVDTKEALSEPEKKIKSSKRGSIKSDKATIQSLSIEVPKNETPSKVFSRKSRKENNQDVEETVKEPISRENQLKPKAGNKSVAEGEKTKQKAIEAGPSDDELRSAICGLLKEADFSKVTFSDVLSQLESKFKVSLSEMKSHVKVLIREEINKIAEEDDGTNDAEGEEEKKDESDRDGSTDQDEDADQGEEE